MSLHSKNLPRLFYLSAVLFFCLNMEAQEFQKRIFLNEKDTLPYNILEPPGFEKKDYKEQTGKSDGQKWPLVLFLHGSGERGNDNQLQIVHIRDLFLNKANLVKYPAFVLAPQCPLGKRWVETHWGVSKHFMPDSPSDAVIAVMRLIEELILEYPIDTSRIYVTGLSMGGFGTWDLICRYPDKFAAAAPVCGGGDISRAKIIKDIPIWVFHGSNDRVVKVKLSRDMVNAIRANGGKPKYTEYPGVGHDSWINAYKEKNFLTWLFSHSLK
jgi:predicted peptidase